MSTNFAHAMTAFPVSNHGAMVTTGMTLRDYFAAKAMQAEMVDGINEHDFPYTAARAYKMADAMIKAREAA